MNAWDILGIAATSKKRDIKRAYAKKLKEFHPEEYPEEFKQIQDAYNTIMDAMNRDFQNPSMVDSLDVDFHVQDNIYQDVKIDEEEESTQSITIHDTFDLTATFQKIDERDGQKTALNITDSETSSLDEKRSAHRSTTPLKASEEDKALLQELLYQKFEETIRYRNDIDTMRRLILNERFYEEMKDPIFYQKIGSLIIRNLGSFDVVVRSFLFDIFSNLESEVHVDTKYCVPEAIRKIQKRERNYRRNNKTFNLVGLIVIIAIAAAVQAVPRMLSHNKQEQRREDSYQLVDEQMNIQRIKDATEYVEDAVYKQKGRTTTCTIITRYLVEDSTVNFHCYPADDVTVMDRGYVILDENIKPSEVVFQAEDSDTQGNS